MLEYGYESESPLTVTGPPLATRIRLAGVALAVWAIFYLSLPLVPGVGLKLFLQ